MAALLIASKNIWLSFPNFWYIYLMVERGVEPRFPVEKPEPEEAPDFSAGDQFSNNQPELAIPPPAEVDNRPESPASKPTFEPDIKTSSEAVNFSTIPDGGDLVEIQNRVESIIEAGEKIND